MVMSVPSEPVMLQSIEEMEAKLGEGIWAIGFQPRLTFQPNFNQFMTQHHLAKIQLVKHHLADM